MCYVEILLVLTSLHQDRQVTTLFWDWYGFMLLVQVLPFISIYLISHYSGEEDRQAGLASDIEQDCSYWSTFSGSSVLNTLAKKWYGCLSIKLQIFFMKRRWSTFTSFIYPHLISMLFQFRLVIFKRWACFGTSGRPLWDVRETVGGWSWMDSGWWRSAAPVEHLGCPGLLTAWTGLSLL